MHKISLLSSIYLGFMTMHLTAMEEDNKYIKISDSTHHQHILKTQANLDNLPNYLVFTVAQYLDLQSAAMVPGVSKSLQEITHDNLYWQYVAQGNKIKYEDLQVSLKEMQKSKILNDLQLIETTLTNLPKEDFCVAYMLSLMKKKDQLNERLKKFH